MKKKIKIQLNPIFLNNKNINNDDVEFDFNFKNHKITKQYIEIIKKLENSDEFCTFEFKEDKVFIDNTPKIPEKIDIDILFLNKEEDVLDLWSAENNILGFHCINSGAFFYNDDDFLSKKHRVAIIIDPIVYQKNYNLNKEFLGEKFDENEFLNIYYNTLVHELIHCKEFIENSNGLTPSEMMNEFENENLKVNFEDIITGHNIIFKSEFFLNEDEINDIMEERVEQKSLNLIKSLNIKYKKNKKQILKI